MSETDAGSGAGPTAGTTQTPSGGGSPAAGAPEGGGGARGAMTPGAGASPETKPDLRSKGTRAVARAREKIAARDAGGAKPGATPGSAEQAAAGATPAGASTPGDPGAKPAATSGDAAADAGTGKPPAPASTVEAPQDWSDDRKARFAALPNDESRALALDFYKDMHKGFTEVMTQVAQFREEQGDLVDLSQRFNGGQAKEVIAELAKRAGIEVFFELPESEEIPDFKDTKEMASWLAKRDERLLDKRLKEQRERDAKETAKREASTQLNRELADAAKAHPDFATHRPKVLEKLKSTPGLTVEEAYSLVTLPALQALVKEAEKAKSELAALKADAERKAKEATRPAAAAQSLTKVNGNSGLPASPGQRALAKAKAKIAARAAPRV